MRLLFLLAIYLSVLCVVGANARHKTEKKQIEALEPQSQETAFQDLLAAIDRSEKTQLKQAQPMQAQLTQVQLMHAQLMQAQLMQAQLMQAQLMQAQLMQAQHIEQQTQLLNKVESISEILNANLPQQKQAEENAENVSRDSKLNASLFLDNPRLLGVTPEVGFISGLTVLDSQSRTQLFVVLGGLTQVNVFDTNNFTSTRNITITGSSSLWAIVASPRYNCLYISDTKQHVVYRYNLSDNVISNWPVGGPANGLSLTSTHNVLVTLINTSQIKEYTPDGSLVRVISLDSSITRPRHSVQLSSGEFVASHGWGESLHRACKVDTSGRIVQCYGGSGGSDIGQLNAPTNLEVDSYDNVLVADSFNDRVVLLSPSLNHLGNIMIPGYSLTWPRALHLDLLTRRLYIGEYFDTGRVFALTV